MGRNQRCAVCLLIAAAGCGAQVEAESDSSAGGLSQGLYASVQLNLGVSAGDGHSDEEGNGDMVTAVLRPDTQRPDLHDYFDSAYFELFNHNSKPAWIEGIIRVRCGREGGPYNWFAYHRINRDLLSGEWTPGQGGQVSFPVECARDTPVMVEADAQVTYELVDE